MSDLERLQTRARQQAIIGHRGLSITLEQLSTEHAKRLFSATGGTEAEQELVYRKIGSMLLTKEGWSAFQGWTEKFGFEGNLLIDLTCSICGRQRDGAVRVAAVQHMENGNFITYLPTSVPSGLWYATSVGARKPMSYSILIAHEIFGHGFRGYGGSTHGHRDVVRTQNLIMTELDSSYDWQSENLRDLRRMGW